MPPHAANPPTAPNDDGVARLRRVEIVLNRRGGALIDRTGDLPSVLARVFAEHAIEARISAVQGRRLARTLGSALARKPDALIVGGGDGTVRTAAELIRAHDSPVPLGVLPLGTFNLLARDLGTPADPLEAAIAIARGRIGRIDGAEVDGRLFLCACIIGFYPKVARMRETLRGRTRLQRILGTISAMVRSLHKSRPVEAAVRFPGRRLIRARTKAIAVSNNPWNEEGGIVPERTDLATGSLGIYVASETDPVALLRSAAAYVARSWQSLDAVERIASPAATLTIAGRRRIRAVIDGDACWLRPPLAFRSLPAAVPMLIPVADDSVRFLPKPADAASPGPACV